MRFRAVFRALLAFSALSSIVQADILAGRPDPAPAGYEDWTSPLITPSPQTVERGHWADAIAKARAFIANLTLEEKVNLTSGVGLLGPCVGNTGSIPRKNFASLCLQDGPAGVRFADFVSVYPSGVNLAAVWDRDLIYQQGAVMGREFREKGINIALTPGMNLARSPAAGRNYEYAGGDLAGVVASQSVRGVQDQGVIACAKHMIAHDQEHARGASLAQGYSVNMDDRTLHEVHLWPFAETVEAGVASVMCSYNRINQTFGCENSYMMNGILKGELGHRGPVISDWSAQTRGIDSALAGLDMDMAGFRAYQDGGTYRSPHNAETGYPGSSNPSISRSSFFGANLIDAVHNNTLPISRLNDMVVRIMAAYYKLGQDKDFPAVNFDLKTKSASLEPGGPRVNFNVDVQHNHKRLIREIGAASAVLLKNEKKALPLDLSKIRSIGLFGKSAGPATNGANGVKNRGGIDGVVAIGYGSGTAEFPYLIDPYSAILMHATSDDNHVSVEGVLNDYDFGQVDRVAPHVDVCLVFVSATSGEAHITVEGNAGDRNDLKLWHNGTELVQRVAASCSNTIVGLQIPSAVDLEGFAEHPNVTGIVNFGLAGQEAGRAVVDILFGTVNPSGRQPYTIGKRREDYCADVQYFNNTGLTVSAPVSTIPQLTYDERLNIDYRHFEVNGIRPRYAFGHGLSYTTFTYSDLRILMPEKPIDDGRHAKRPLQGLEADLPEHGEMATGHHAQIAFAASQNFSTSGDTAAFVRSIPPRRLQQQPDNLFEDLIEVTFSIATAGRNGHEVAQLYLSFPTNAEEPPKVLRGFERVWIQDGSSAQVKLPLRRKDISIWDTPSALWIIPKGTFTVHIGASSDDIRLTGTFAI